jgi:hypothetical protein
MTNSVRIGFLGLNPGLNLFLKSQRLEHFVTTGFNPLPVPGNNISAIGTVYIIRLN